MAKSFAKLCAIYCIRAIMLLLHIFPVKKERIIFNAYTGRQYACNPKYITEYLLENFPGKYELIWGLKDAHKYHDLRDRGIKVVEYVSLKRMFYEATAKVSINNVGSFSWMPNTKNQLRINTWHGGGCYKKVGLGESNNDKLMKKTIKMTADNTSYMLATSRYNADVVWPHDFGYHGKILRIGFPRNDILINGDMEQIHRKVCRDLNIAQDKKIVMFAPTWRYETVDEIVLPNFMRLKEACRKRFGGNWEVLFRAHDLMMLQMDGSEYIDVTKYPDMQELLVASDMLISDYSSCIWDYSLQLVKPCLLFTPDIESYTRKRGFDIDIFKWGFPVCVTEDELIENIKIMNLDDFADAMRRHHNDLGSYDKGNACEKICQVIEKFCFE